MYAFDDEKMKELLDSGFNPNVPCDIRGYNPLHIAINQCNFVLVEFLLSHNASVHVKIATSGLTPLHLSAMKNCCEIMELLFSAGARVDEADYFGDTPLHESAMWNCLEASKLLLIHGANVFAKNKSKQTPLEITARTVLQTLFQQAAVQQQEVSHIFLL